MSYTLTVPVYVTFSQASGSLSATDDTKVSFSIDPSKLKLGINRKDIAVTFQPGGMVESVPVMAAYIPRGAVAAALLPALAPPVQTGIPVSRSATTNCNPSQIGFVATGLPGGFSRHYGVALPVQVRAIDDCGNPVGNANVMLTFVSGEQAVIAAPDNVAAGTYSANWNPSVVGDMTMAGSPLAAGTVASIYGEGLANGTQGATALPLPTVIDGTSVSVGGIDATPGVAAFADGTLIAQHANYQLVDADYPATQNKALILYLVGMGATSPAVATGQVAPSDPLARTPSTPKVTIDGKDAPVAYSGLTPEGIGLYQIVITVPSGIVGSGPKDVAISLNGASANPTKLLVSAP